MILSQVEKDVLYNWHPYTQMKACERHPPVLISHATGIKLFDTDNQYYYDTISSWWCNLHGHNHPYINQAMVDQIHTFSHIMFSGLTHSPAIRLSERIVKITSPGLRSNSRRIT